MQAAYHERKRYPSNQIKLVLKSGVDREDFVQVLTEIDIETKKSDRPNKRLIDYLLKINMDTGIYTYENNILKKRTVYHRDFNRNQVTKKNADIAFVSLSSPVSDPEIDTLLYCHSDAQYIPFSLKPPLELEYRIHQILNKKTIYKDKYSTINLKNADQSQFKISMNTLLLFFPSELYHLAY